MKRINLVSVGVREAHAPQQIHTEVALVWADTFDEMLSLIVESYETNGDKVAEVIPCRTLGAPS